MTQSPTTPLPSVKERRALREAKDLTQDQVAAKVGVSRATVRRWETGRSNPRGHHRVEYARLLMDTGHTGHTRGTSETRGTRETRETRETQETRDIEKRGPGHPPTEHSRQPKPRTRRTKAATTTAHPAEAAAATTASPTTTTTTTAMATATATVSAVATADDDAAHRLTPDQAFDALYAFTAPALVRQTYLLTGRRALAREAVERAFYRAWEHWPEVAVDPDPVGWVRASAYEYALSPWHRLRRGHRVPEAPPAEPEDRQLLDVLLSLPPSYRRTLVLYDGVGLDLPETAAETEASTPAAANRLLHAREAVAEQLPELADPDVLHARLAELAAAEKLEAPKAVMVRQGSEHRAQFWMRAAIAFTVLIIGASMLALATSPTGYEPERAPGEAVSGVPPRMGPGKLSEAEQDLRKKLRSEPANGPERIHPFVE